MRLIGEELKVATVCAAIALVTSALVPVRANADEGYHAAFFGESAFLSLAPGQTGQFAVGFTNTGSLSWTKSPGSGQASLHTATPLDNNADWSAGWAVDWPAPNIYALLSADVTSPGQTGYFVYSIRAPATASGPHYFYGRVFISGTGFLEDWGYYQIVTATGGANVPSTATPPPISAPTQAPTPTPAPTAAPNPPGAITYQLGQQIAFSDGWRVVAQTCAEQTPGTYDRPDPGMRFVACAVRYDNYSSSTQYASPSDFKLQDGSGVRRSRTFYLGRSDLLSGGYVAPGASSAGTIVFQAPIGDLSLSLIYDGSFSHGQATYRVALSASASLPSVPAGIPNKTFVSGQTVVYPDGWKLTLQSCGEQQPTTYDQPDPGLRFVVCSVRFENAGTSAVYASASDFVLEDSLAVRRSRTFFLGRNDSLSSGNVAPGGTLAGTMVFLAPVGDSRLQLLYGGGFSRDQTTFRLF